MLFARNPSYSVLTYVGHTLFTDVSNYAYSGILTQAADGPDDLKPMAYTSGSYT